MPESIELALESKDDLPWIEVDPGLVEQALLNLCVNARDAMPEGGKLTVSTRPFSDPEGADWVEISVTDNGSGMCEKVQQKAFEPFFSTKGPQGGTGLGLPMVYGTVHQCGGSVVLTSKPGAGTTVTLAFPACDIVNEDSDVPAHQAEGGSGTILVVEDEDSIRNLVAKVLRKAGYSVLEACDGREGVETFMAEQKVDLVLMDAVMPKMNGRQACERILEIQPKAQILFTSGYHASEVLSQDFLEARGLEILAKPYSPTKLVEVVHTTLSKVRPS